MNSTSLVFFGLDLFKTFLYIHSRKRQWRPTQYSCLKNPMDGGAWQATVYGVTKSQEHDWATSLLLITFMHWTRKWQPTPVFLPRESQGWGAWWAAVSGVLQSRTRQSALAAKAAFILTLSYLRRNVPFGLKNVIDFGNFRVTYWTVSFTKDGFRGTPWVSHWAFMFSLLVWFSCGICLWEAWRQFINRRDILIKECS